MKLAWPFASVRIAAPGGQTRSRSRHDPRPRACRRCPASVSQALNRYQNIRSASFQDWDSAGAGMYITTRFADVPQVHWVAEPGGARTQLTFLAERVRSGRARPRHDQFLYLDGRGRGREQSALSPGSPVRRRAAADHRRQEPEHGAEMVAVGRPAGLEQQRPQRPRHGPLRRRARRPSFCPPCSRRSPGQWTVADWSPDETRVVAVEYISINESYIHIIEVATGKTETVTPRPSDRQGRAGLLQSTALVEGRPIALLPDRPGERVPPPGSSSTWHRDRSRSLTDNISWDVEEFDLSDDGELIAWVVNEGGVSQIGCGPANSGRGLAG